MRRVPQQHDPGGVQLAQVHLHARLVQRPHGQLGRYLPGAVWGEVGWGGVASRASCDVMRAIWNKRGQHTEGGRMTAAAMHSLSPAGPDAFRARRTSSAHSSGSAG